jgi:serine/threonine protein kinase
MREIDLRNYLTSMGERESLLFIDIDVLQLIFCRMGSNGTWPYSAPEVTKAADHHMTLNTSKADVWSWGAVLYRITYSKAPNYTPPCHRPPKDHRSSRDPNLVDVLRHTLVIDSRERSDPTWLARHPYTTKH